MDESALKSEGSQGSSESDEISEERQKATQDCADGHVQTPEEKSVHNLPPGELTRLGLDRSPEHLLCQKRVREFVHRGGVDLHTFMSKYSQMAERQTGGWNTHLKHRLETGG